MKYFAYSPDLGIEFFNTGKEARDKAQEEIDFYRDSAGDWGWHENTGDIVWGVVMQQATEVKEPIDTGTEGGYYSDFVLKNASGVFHNDLLEGKK